MEAISPTRTASTDGQRCSGAEGFVPADVLAAIGTQPEVSTLDTLKRLTARLEEMWSVEAGRLVRDERLLGKLNTTDLAKEIGYRLRVRNYVPPNEARQALGGSDFRIDTKIAELATTKKKAGTIILPSVEDRALVGVPSSPGASHLNPYIWVQVIERHSKTGQNVWEVAPGWVSSASEVGKRMSRQVVLAQPPGRTATDVVYRVDPHQKSGGHSGQTPSLVLVPLPLPEDAFSVMDSLRAHIQTAGHRGNENEAVFRLWPSLNIDTVEVQQVEFACDFDAYLKAVSFRLRRINEVVQAGTKIAVVSPMVRGTSRAVEKLIQREFADWKLVERTLAFEGGGKTHKGNGTPLLGDVVTIWEVR